MATCLALLGCVDVSGGAVQARWALRIKSCPSNNCTCMDAQVAQMEIVMIPTGGGADPCAVDHRCRFVCSEQKGEGITKFVIPEGEYAISLQAIDPSGKVLGPEDRVSVPAPVVRSVFNGQLTDLNVNLIIVDR
jgi:hypothetical protein